MTQLTGRNRTKTTEIRKKRTARSLKSLKARFSKVGPARYDKVRKSMKNDAYSTRSIQRVLNGDYNNDKVLQAVESICERFEAGIASVNRRRNIPLSRIKYSAK